MTPGTGGGSRRRWREPRGQPLFAYLVLNRLRRIDRDELLLAVYGEGATPDHQPRLSVVLSKLRRVLGPELLTGRAQIELVLPACPADENSAEAPNEEGPVCRPFPRWS